MIKVKQSFIDKISGKPKLFERWCKRYNENKNFSNLDFSNLNFNNKNFDYFNFNSASFYNASFYRASFNSASFNRASFNNASFNSASFNRASFNNASFNSALFNNALFYSASFNSASFNSASFNSASFNNASFNSASFYSASFYSASFEKCKGIRSILKHYISIDLKLKILGINKTKNYYIAYKSFGDQYNIPKKWVIKKNSIIKEHIDNDIWKDCSYGINVADKKWCDNNCENDIWLIHIPFDSEICVPAHSDGKFRVSKCKLIRKIKG